MARPAGNPGRARRCGDALFARRARPAWRLARRPTRILATSRREGGSHDRSGEAPPGSSPQPGPPSSWRRWCPSRPRRSRSRVGNRSGCVQLPVRSSSFPLQPIRGLGDARPRRRRGQVPSRVRSVFEFSAGDASRIWITDEDGNLHMFDRGSIRSTILFATLGDGTVGASSSRSSTRSSTDRIRSPAPTRATCSTELTAWIALCQSREASPRVRAPTGPTPASADADAAPRWVILPAVGKVPRRVFAASMRGRYSARPLVATGEDTKSRARSMPDRSAGARCRLNDRRDAAPPAHDRPR